MTVCNRVVANHICHDYSLAEGTRLGNQYCRVLSELRLPTHVNEVSDLI